MIRDMPEKRCARWLAGKPANECLTIAKVIKHPSLRHPRLKHVATHICELVSMLTCINTYVLGMHIDRRCHVFACEHRVYIYLEDA